MKQIDDYVESLFKNFGKSKDVAELKEETRNHLLESVNDLLAEGKTDEESVSLAIERFGDNNHLNGELENVFKVRRAFARGVLYISFVLLAIALVVGLYGTVVNSYYVYSQQTVGNKTLSILRSSTLPLSPAKKKEIQSIVQNNSFSIQHIAIYPSLPNRATPANKPDFVYPPSTASKYHSPVFGYVVNGVNGKWFMQFDVVSNPVIPHVWLRHYVPRAALLGYWILFAVWASINAYHRKRLTMAWIVAFACLNFFAWILFRSSKPYGRVHPA